MVAKLTSRVSAVFAQKADAVPIPDNGFHPTSLSLRLSRRCHQPHNISADRVRHRRLEQQLGLWQVERLASLTASLRSGGNADS